MSSRLPAALVDPQREGVNWAMASSLDDASRRRIYIQLSAQCALLSSAAKRRQNDLDLDDREVDALRYMQKLLNDAARNLRSDTEPRPASSPAPRFEVRAFAFVARAASEGHYELDQAHDAESLADDFDNVADQLNAVVEWAGDKKTAAEVATRFEWMSRQLLQGVARPGESIESPRPRSMA